MHPHKAVLIALLFPLLFLPSPAVLTGQTASRTSQALNLPFFQIQSVHQETTNTFSRENQEIMMQEEGVVDTVKVFLVALPLGVLPEDVSFEQSVTNNKVLNVSGNENIISMTSAENSLNVTCSLSFDQMVGETDYTLIVRQNSSKIILRTFTVRFLIAGVTFYTENSSGNVIIVSGESNSYIISMENALLNQVNPSDQIKVFVQYPDGSSTKSVSGNGIPFVDSLSVSIEKLNGEIVYNPSKCAIQSLGSINDEGFVQYPEACGCGFYKNPSSGLSFGFDFQPYRIGNFVLRFSWPGLTAKNMILSEEIFSCTLNVGIRGSPQLVVAGVKPESGLLRSEGGQQVQCQVLNADYFNLTSLWIEVEDIGIPFSAITGSYKKFGVTSSKYEVSFLSEPGTGTNLNWTLFYNSSIVQSSNKSVGTDEAIFLPELSHQFTYDNEKIHIDSVTPLFGKEEGGEEITIKGYFPGFDTGKDGIYFTESRITQALIVSVTNTSIVFTTPSRESLGQSYEYHISIRIGNAVSNTILFSFLLTKASVRISMMGTSEIDEETYKFGDCTAARFTAIVAPFTNQIQSYHWSLHHAANTKINVLQSANFQDIDSNVQTLELDSGKLEVGIYSLHLTVKLKSVSIEKKIDLLRETDPNIGAYILDVPPRTVSYPDTPLRIFAVVRDPNQCGGNGAPKIVENRTMIVEWSAFGVTQRFSAASALQLPPSTKLAEPTAARLGWEFIVPKHNLTSGTHKVQFNVWLAEQEEVRGQATSIVTIKDASLIAIIRSGEEYLTVSKQSSLTIFANNSYDLDIQTGDKYADLTYSWICRQSETRNFSESASSPCYEAFLENDTSPSFEVSFKAIEAIGSIKFIQYSLVIEKDVERVSDEKRLIIEIQDDVMPHVSDFLIQIVDGNGDAIEGKEVPHDEQIVINVNNTDGALWSYELLEPFIPNFFSNRYLLENPEYYSVPAEALFPSTDSKALGITGGSLRASTEYRFKIIFEPTESIALTETVFSFRTSEATAIGLPVPTITKGTVTTTLTATAGTPSTFQAVAYYFLLEDSEGNEFCAGGCTGADVVHYQIARPGTYKLTAYMFDMQGKTLLDSVALDQRILILGPMETKPFQPQLNALFMNGNDNYWTQLANEVTVILLKENLSETEKSLLPGIESPTESSLEDIRAARMDMSSDIAIGSRSVHCSSYPNTYHGKYCIDLAYKTLRQDLLQLSTIYDVMVTMLCCVKNTPLRTAKLASEVLPKVIVELHRLSRNLYQAGSSRRRLLATSTKRDNLGADIHTWTIDCLTESNALDKPHGFFQRTAIGEDGELTVVVASNPYHIQGTELENTTARIIEGNSDSEAFFLRDECLNKVFSDAGGKTIYFGSYAMDNFVVGGNFNGPPVGTNLVDKLYWVKIFSLVDGEFTQIGEMSGDCCFCWILPVVREQEFLHESLDYMPGIYAFKNLKKFQEDVPDDNSGQIYDYDYDGTKTSDHDSLAGWMIGCREDVGLVGSTIVSKTADNALIDYSGSILGIPNVMGAALVIGALMLVVVTLVAGWLIAVRAVSDTVVPPSALDPGMMYVERDIYGRGSIFGGNPGESIR